LRKEKTMNEPLKDDVYKRRGISLLWDIANVKEFCDAKKGMSLRSFLLHYANQWKLTEKAVSKSKALLVAGLEGCIDSMNPQDAEEFLRDIVYPAIISFQNKFAGGGANASLILWVGDSSRIEYQTISSKLYYQCSLYKQKIPLGQCLFRGAESDLLEITTKQDGKENVIGLYQQRIS